MKQMNPEHVAALMELINHGPFFQLLSMRIRAIEPAYARVELDLERKHLNPFGSVHGGVYSSLIDTASYWSVYGEMEEHVGYTTIDLSVNYLSMIQEGKITVEGKSIKIGRSICLAEAIAKDEQGRLLVYGTSKLMVLGERQSIDQAIASMGYQALPAKFIGNGTNQ